MPEVPKKPLFKVFLSFWSEHEWDILLSVDIRTIYESKYIYYNTKYTGAKTNVNKIAKV